MGKLILHTGPNDSYYFFNERILEHLKSNQPEIFLYLLPVNRAVRYFKKQLTYDSPSGILIDPNIYTFASLMLHMYKKLPQQKKLISNTMRLVLVNFILNEKKRELEYFNFFRSPESGLVNKIDKMLAEFCEFGYRPKDFAFGPITAQEKYHDFARILTSLHRLFNNQLIDESNMILEVVDNLNERIFRETFPHVKRIYINGYGIYTPPMLKFIKKIRDWCEVNIKLEYDTQNKSLFNQTSNAFDALSKLAYKIYPSRGKEDLLYRKLFNTVSPLSQKGKGEIRICIQKAKNRKEEVSFIAARIKRYFHEQKIPLHEIGVTFPDIETYAPLIHILFKEHELPYNLSTGLALTQSPLIKTYLQVLKIVINGFHNDDISDLIISPFINFDPLDDDKIQNRLTILVGDHPAHYFHSEYLKILNDLGLMNWYERDTEFLSRIEREREFRALNRFIKLLNQLNWIQDYLYGEKEFNLRRFYQNLILILQDATYNIKEWSNYGVQILPRLEIQSVNLKVLFIGGLIEGKFPRQYTRDIFFNDSERQVMGLNACEDLLDQDRFLFYQLLSSPIQQVALSYPAFEQDIGLLRSTFIANLLDIYDVEVNEKDINEKNLLSNKSTVEYIGKNLKEGLSKDDKLIFQDWLMPENLDKAEYWLDAVEIINAKNDRRQITEFEGNLSANLEIMKFLKTENSHRPFSVTALESYAFCPMQYFLQRILLLPEEEEHEETISALDRGLLIHKILFRFYTHLKKIGKHLRAWEHKELLYKIADEEFEKMPYSGLLWTLEKENIFGNNEHVGLWDTFLEIEEKETKSSGFQPQYFEVSFGYTGSDDSQDEISTDEPMVIRRANDEIRIVGKIDRIDCNAQNQAVVFDYKTGSVNPYTVTKIYDGSSLQLPIYLEYVRQRLQDMGKNYIPVAGAYYQVKDVNACKRKIVLADNERTQKLNVTGTGRLPNKKFTYQSKSITFRQMIDRSLKFVIDYVEDLNNGNFQHTRDPEDLRCSQYCPYNKVCRKDVAKILAMNER